jgi:hypothetical protein
MPLLAVGLLQGDVAFAAGCIENTFSQNYSIFALPLSPR